MDSNTTAAVRDIFAIIAAGVFTVLCITVIALALKLYRPLRDTVANSARATENLKKITGDVSVVSEETSGNIAQASRNAVTITENLKQGSEDLSDTVRNAREAAKNVASAASTVGTIAETVSRFSSLGVSGGGGGGSGVGTMLRLLRNVFGGSGRRSDDGGGQRGA